MIGFLGEIGQNLGDRWTALLAIPGLLYLAAITAAVSLGQDSALSYPAASKQVSAWAASPALKSAGGAVLVAAAVLAGSILAGLASAAGGASWKCCGRCPASAVRPAGWPGGGGTARSTPRPTPVVFTVRRYGDISPE